ncbi:HAMP domain-containing sensor histidine kinase [Paenibacillus sp. y28]|uniref:HAMP domain-containing sensor histidine kinase n=1 Tax=Paenibacillus sp. y28 TaxID=3129110 RepID=UPI003016D593
MNNKKPRISLQKQIVLTVSLVTVIMVSLIVIFSAYTLENSVKQAYVSQINGMTEAINGRYEQSRSTEEVQQIFDYIQNKDNRVLELRLYDTTGRILASSDRYWIGKTLSPIETVIPAQDKTIIDRSPVGLEEEVPGLRLLAPLQEDGKVVGVVDVLLDTTEEANIVSGTISFIIAASALSAVLLLVVLWLAIRRIVILPLMRLREAAVTVKQGGAPPKLDFRASPEIEEVAEAFKDMVLNLEIRYRDLQTALESLQSAQEQLIQSEKMSALGSLVAGVSHEINTPIGIGVTAVSFLDQKAREFQSLYRDGKMKKSDLDQFLANVGETTEMIQANLQRASHLVHNFKQVSIDQTSEIKRSFHLKEYMDGVVVSLGPTLKKAGHCVSVTCDPSLELYSYPGALSQIMTNLVMNSIHHAYDEGRAGNLAFRVTAGPQAIQIVYADDGKGMPREVLDKIFDPFFTTKRGKGGTGLGMNIVYNLVTQSLGGVISGESEVGRGSRFSIEIPIEEEPLYEL